MTKKSNEISPKLKYYHIILIAMIISPFLVLNSNSVNKKKEQRKIFKQNEIFMRKLYGRNLSFKEDTNIICKKGTEELQQYYETGDSSKIGLKEGPIKNNKNDEYINALINIVSGDSSGENIKTYLMHLIPVLIFVVITIFFLPGWLVCCICSCCNCCCCCCCKKPQCKFPFYIVTCVIYALGIAISIYGLSQSNSVFVGLADTECSILKFVGEVLEGETKQELPRWGGIGNIKGIFEQTKDNINSLTETTRFNLNQDKELSKASKNNFESALETYSQKIEADSSSTDGGDYKQDLTSLSGVKRGIYILDIVKTFGTFSKNAADEVTATPNSFVYSWYTEYNLISQNSDSQMQTAYENFDNLISQKDNANSALESGISSIATIQDSFDSIKDSISQAIIEYSDIIEDYGKLGFKVVFSVLMVIDAAIAVFITLRIFTQFLVCKNPCIQCLLKSIIHILWNILALLTFFSLFLGFIFTLLGAVGKDLISVVSFVVSDENLNKNDDAALIGGGAGYLKTCINGDGDLQKALNLDISSMNNIENLKNASFELKSLKNQTEMILGEKRVYKEYYQKYKDRKDYKITDFDLIKTDNTNRLTLSEYLGKLNIDTSSKKDEWKVSCDASKKKPCSPVLNDPSNEFCIELSSCLKDQMKAWYSSETGTFGEDRDIVNAFINSINVAKKSDPSYITQTTPVPNTKSIENVLGILDNRYSIFLDSQTSSLQTFIDTIEGLTNIFNDFAGEEGGVFTILNCLFIGRNVKVILKYLDKCLGTNLYTVGICMLITGIAMCFSIAFTILLNIIINASDTTYHGDGVPELGNDENDPNIHLENSPQGNYDTEKVNYGENYNQNNYNNENLNGGVRVINYNN